MGFFNHKKKMSKLLERQKKLGARAQRSEQVKAVKDSITRQKERIHEAGGDSFFRKTATFTRKGIQKATPLATKFTKNVVSNITRPAKRPRSSRHYSRKRSSQGYAIIGGEAYPLAKRKTKRRKTKKRQSDNMLGNFNDFF